MTIPTITLLEDTVMDGAALLGLSGELEKYLASYDHLFGRAERRVAWMTTEPMLSLCRRGGATDGRPSSGFSRNGSWDADPCEQLPSPVPQATRS